MSVKLYKRIKRVLFIQQEEDLPKFKTKIFHETIPLIM